MARFADYNEYWFEYIHALNEQYPPEYWREFNKRYNKDIQAIEESYIKTNEEFDIWKKELINEIKEVGKYEYYDNHQFDTDDGPLRDNRVLDGERVRTEQSQSYDSETIRPAPCEYEGSDGEPEEEGRHLITDEDIWGVIGKPLPRKKSRHKSGKKKRR